MQKLERLPTGPGVYLMKDADGVVLYVGKASNLRARVRSYFSGGDGRAQIQYLVAEIRDLDFSLAADAREALILEDVLIKKYRPRYNIKLRDDKTYLSIRFDLRVPFPKIELIRRPKSDGARYFGPYSSASHVRSTLNFIKRCFPLRTCEDGELRRRARPCLQYQINRCLAPCVDRVDREQYREVVDQVVLVLEGKDRELLDRLGTKMKEAADRLEFEHAASFRDRLRALETVTAQQQVVSHARVDRDIIGVYREVDEVAVAVIPVRRGRMQDNRTFVFRNQMAEDEEVLASFLNQLYGEDEFVPSEVLVPLEIYARDALEDILGERAGYTVHLRTPKRGGKARLVDLAVQTAKAALAQELDQGQRGKRACRELQRVLKLPFVPRTLECFDISNTSGRQPVASRVRFEHGLPQKEGYRRYRIKTLEERPNDYGMMREVLERRIRRGRDADDLPDVLVVDGGKGQLNIAVAVLRELEVSEQTVLALAKPDSLGVSSRYPIRVDKIFLPDRKNPIVLPPYSPALRMLQALRDESHRFALTYHRSLRRKHSARSILDDIPGVGEKRRKLLLRTFGSVKRLQKADVLEIAAVEGIGPVLAGQISAHLGIGKDLTTDEIEEERRGRRERPPLPHVATDQR